MVICQTCGAHLVDDAIFCTECGIRLVAPPLQKREATYAGTYVLQTPEVTVALLFQQDSYGKISGTFSSTRGTQFQVDGQVEEDAVVGLCYDAQGRVYFEARQNGNQLMLALIELDANNMPDYNKMRQLILTKQEGGAVSGVRAQPVEPSLFHPPPHSTTIVEESQASNLMQNFAGTWVNYTRNTETRITLVPTGEYFENYEASYGGQFGNQYGVSTGGWGTARQDQNRGRWTVRGSREQGQIIIRFQDGRQTMVNYQVHIEKGQTYWNEYFFNGELYGRHQ